MLQVRARFLDRIEDVTLSNKDVAQSVVVDINEARAPTGIEQRDFTDAVRIGVVLDLGVDEPGIDIVIELVDDPGCLLDFRDDELSISPKGGRSLAGGASLPRTRSLRPQPCGPPRPDADHCW